MITEWIFEVFTFIPRFIISSLPAVDIRIPDGVFEGIYGLLGGVAYIMPIAGLMPILYISLGMDAVKIAMAGLVRVKSFIPTMGS